MIKVVPKTPKNQNVKLNQKIRKKNYILSVSKKEFLKFSKDLKIFKQKQFQTRVPPLNLKKQHQDKEKSPKDVRITKKR